MVFNIKWIIRFANFLLTRSQFQHHFTSIFFSYESVLSRFSLCTHILTIILGKMLLKKYWRSWLKEFQFYDNLSLNTSLFHIWNSHSSFTVLFYLLKSTFFHWYSFCCHIPSLANVWSTCCQISQHGFKLVSRNLFFPSKLTVR